MDAKLQEILIKAKKDVFTQRMGENLSTLRGDGLDFREIREYQIGDDVKKINWNATAKTNTIEVNVFDVNKELSIVLVFLVSGSMYFGATRFKQDVAAEILAYLSYSTIKNNNILSTLVYSTKEEFAFFGTKSELGIHKSIESTLNAQCLKKEINYESLCDHINTSIKQKSIIFLVGDFYGDINLASIAYKHEVYALVVRDRFEEYPNISGDYDFVSPIDLKATQITLDAKMAKKFQNALKKEDDLFFEHCFANGITVAKIYTDEDVYLRLSEILKG